MFTIASQIAVATATGITLTLTAAGPSPAVSDWLFPSDWEMHDIIGVRTDRYEFPAHNVMERWTGYRNTKCSPRFAYSALSVGSWSYNLVGGPHGSVTVTVWKYPGHTSAFNAVNKHRKRMSGCRSYRLYLRGQSNDQGYPMKTSGVNGSRGQLRMRNKYEGSVKTAQREWLTAVDQFVVQVEVEHWGVKRPAFPPKRIPREVTAWMRSTLRD